MSNSGEHQDDSESKKTFNQNDEVGKSVVETLSAAGLDGEYWAAILEKRLHITQAIQIQFIGRDELNKISGDKRDDWELKALRKCVGISEDPYPTSKDEHQNKQKEEAKQLLNDVKTLREEGASHTNAMIISKLDRLRSIMDVTDEKWIKPSDNNNLDTMVSKLTSDFEKMETLSGGRSTLSASELLERASGGLALRGVLLGAGPNADLKRTVLRTPADVKLTSPSMSYFEKDEHFSSREQSDHFTRSLDTMGHSFTAAAKGGGFALSGYIAAEAGGSKKHEEEVEEKHESHKQTSYEYKIKYAFIPTAACQIKKGSLRLTEEAIEDLKEIENILAINKDDVHKQVVNNKCTEFLKNFGSHINVGVLHFGGVNKSTANFTSETKSDTNTVKAMMQDTLSAYASVSYSSLAFSVGGSVGYDQMKNHASFKGDHSESELKKITFQTTRNGGPQEQDYFPLWRRGLMQYNSTWAIIDRGEPLTENFVEIWKVVSEHHRVDFQEPDKLMSSLRAAWEKMTGYLESKDNRNERVKEECLNQAIDAMDDMTKQITDLNSLPIEPNECVKNLNLILKTVVKVEQLTGTNKSWENEVCTNEHIYSFLTKIVELNDQFEPGAVPEIRYLMRKLIEPVGSAKFPGKQGIVDWTEGVQIKKQDEVPYIPTDGSVKTIPDLIQNMKGKFVVALRAAHENNDKHDVMITDQINRRATTDLTLCVSNLLAYLHMSNKLEQMVFLNVTLLSLDFDCSKKKFKIVLEMDKILNFVEQIKPLWDQFQEHKKKGRIQLEAFVIHTLLTSDHFRTHTPEDEFSEITKDFRQVLSQQLIKVLDNYSTVSPFDWKEMTNVTAKLKEGNLSVVEEIKVDICDLKEVFIAEDNCKPSKREDAEDAFSNMIQALGLDEYYPSKISLSDALVLRKETEQPTLVDLPWMIINRLIMIDYRARDNLFTLLPRIQCENYDDWDDIPKSGEDYVSRVCPLDVLVAIFACCDNIVKQTLAQKLFVCKLAIPFLYPLGLENELMVSLWALRKITIDCENGDEKPVTGTPLPIATFVRLGRPPISKSKLMNDILMDGKHDTFINKDCYNGTETRKLSDGLVECSWLLTAARRKEEHLPKTTMFLNLRGDASSLEKQLLFLQEISSVMFVIVSAHDLAKSLNTITCQNILQSDTKVILLILGNNREEEATSVKAVGIDLLKKKGAVRMRSIIAQGLTPNATELKIDAKTKLSKIINDASNWKRLEEECARLAEKRGVIIDEHDDDSCIEGKKLADDVLRHINRDSIVECKKRELPLQDIEWRKYCQYQKKQHRESDPKEAEKMKQQMNSHRKKQVERCQNGLTPLIKDFMSNLNKKTASAQYFLKWITLYLDDISRETLPNLQRDYNKHWKRCEESKKNTPGKSPDNLDKDRASLGLEHLFRELGQLFEAVKGCNNASEDSITLVDRLPGTVARLLLKGNPMEIIDGDTSSVPRTWVCAVLSELENIIGKKKLFVVSVLGIQSSGKSTLLNTMFGLQFSVSAGRCTRGAYMQLIPVYDGWLPFDYVVVIDTEGLRATELSQFHYNHDNELATLVIGLGDVIMINIKGENTSEMKDILQIAVHAFLRMDLVSKNVKNDKTCIFLHQNVPATNANQMLKPGSQALLDTLNKMTREAAASEKRADIYRFSQIINFDVDRHVLCFSDLWQGNPPMAPANFGYSDDVRAVKLYVLDEISKNQTSFLTPLELSMRIADIWKGVLADDFVFSFRNSLELKANQAMQSKFNKLKWELTSHLLTWRNQAENELMVKENIEELTKEYDTLRSKLPNVLDAKAKTVRTDLEDYFKNNEPHLISQWESSKMTQLDNAIDEENKGGEENLRRAYESHRLKILSKQQWSHTESDIIKKAKTLAVELKGKEMNDLEKERQFNELWEKSKNELATTTETNEKDMHLLIGEILHKRFSSTVYGHHLSPELEKHPLDSPLAKTILEGTITIEDVSDSDISVSENSGLEWVKDELGLNRKDLAAKQRTVEETESIFKSITTYLTNLKQNRSNELKSSYGTKVINIIIEYIEAFNAEKGNFFQIHPAYTIKLAVHVSRHCVMVFNEMRSDYNKEHGIIAKLEERKEGIWVEFKNMLDNSTEEIRAGNKLCVDLKRFIKEQVRKNIPARIVTGMINDFASTKYRLIIKILTDLAEKSDFDSYASYIRGAKTFASSWLEKKTNEYTFEYENTTETKSRYARKCQNHINQIMECVRDSVNHATEQVERAANETEKMRLWVEQFCKKVVNKIAVPESELREVTAKKVVNFSHLKTIIYDQLDKVEAEVVKVFADESSDTVEWKGKHPASILLEKVWGCDAQCPFCKEPCSNTTLGHYEQKKECHRCVKHKPTGIKGTRWGKTYTLDCDICSYSITSDQHFYCSVSSNECRKYGKCTTKGKEEERHDYMQYKTFLPHWDIDPDSGNNGSKYWRWFMNKYKYQLTDLHKAKLPEIPESWKSITMEEALKDLENYCN